MRKKKVIINTDWPGLKTGLGKNCKELASYLYKTGKYDVILYACGLAWQNSEFNRFPFKTYGTLPMFQSEMNEIRSKGPNAERDAAYGSYNIDRLIEEEKPDIFITSNDSWASNFYLDKPWLKKLTYIPHLTYDSLPFLPDQVTYFDKVPKVYVWADFAVKEAKRLGKNNVEKLTGIINPEHFKKISPVKRRNLRARFNIAEDAFVIIKCSRNQIRKQFKSVLEGYAEWKKTNRPTKPTYVLFHTNFKEPGGWDFFRFCDELGIDKKELLTSYVCNKCKEYHVSMYQGENHDCPYCGASKSFNNINIQTGLTEEQLNEVYGISDCMVHGADAAGLEITCVEGLYCELPLATNSYAALETFTSQPFVKEIPCTFTTQLHTQFKRAVLNPSAIARFLQDIYVKKQKDPYKLIEIGRQGREWAVSNFSPSVVCKQWEQILDEAPYADWTSAESAKEKKDPTAAVPFNEKEPVIVWIKNLYKYILKMEVSDNDSGVQYWVNHLAQGATRKSVEDYFRDVAVKDTKPETKLEDYILQNGKKNLLIVLKESLGDVFISTAILDGLRESYPSDKYNIYYATDPINFEILEGNPNIDVTLPYQPGFENEINCIGHGNTKGPFDVYINLGIPTQRQLNYLTNNNLSR